MASSHFGFQLLHYARRGWRDVEVRARPRLPLSAVRRNSHPQLRIVFVLQLEVIFKHWR